MTLGQYAMMLIIGWQTYNIARDSGMSVAEASGQLALIGLLQFVPLFLLTPFSGWAADHFDRRNLGRATIALQFLCASALAWLTWSDSIALWSIYSVAIVLGVVRAFNGPAMSALAPNLVPKAILPNAIALSSIGWQTGTHSRHRSTRHILRARQRPWWGLAAVVRNRHSRLFWQRLECFGGWQDHNIGGPEEKPGPGIQMPETKIPPLTTVFSKNFLLETVRLKNLFIETFPIDCNSSQCLRSYKFHPGIVFSCFDAKGHLFMIVA